MDIIRLTIPKMDKPTLILTFFIFAAVIALTVSHAILSRKNRKMTIWRLFCLAPLAASAAHYVFFHLRGSIIYTIVLYGIMYFAALLLAVWQFFYRRKYGYRIFAVCVNFFAVVNVLIMIFVISVNFASINNFSRLNYTEAFKSTVDVMETDYVLSDWKEIDYAALEEEILPMVEKAEQEQDAAGYAIALMTYCYRFYDSHVVFDTIDVRYDEEIKNRLAGNDYGFSMVTLDSGDTIAILTEENSEAGDAGIHDGTVITKWNGVPLEEAKKNIECIYPTINTFPVAENEAYMKAFFLAGKGEEENQVTFIDDNGREQTTMLKSRGSYCERLDTAISCFYHRNIEDENFSCKMLSEDCGYLRVSKAGYTAMGDSKASVLGNYTEIISLLNERLGDMREEGMTKLIIDLRNNGGGIEEASTALASVFSKEEYFSAAVGEDKDGEYTVVHKRYVSGDGEFSDIKIVVLVNAECMSAGDSMAKNLSGLPNVTLMGITTSSGVDQCVGGWCFLSDSSFAVIYPNLLTLDENNEPRIDTKADRVSRIQLDVHIPLTAEAAMYIFGGKEDYELNYALHYIENTETEE